MEETNFFNIYLKLVFFNNLFLIKFSILSNSFLVGGSGYEHLKEI